MGSLFQDGCGCGGVSPTPPKSNCKGCICEQLANLDCNGLTSPSFYIIQKGQDDEINLYTSEDTPTLFTFVGYNPHTCCATFTYTAVDATYSTYTPRFIIDCRSIAALIPVAPGTV